MTVPPDEDDFAEYMATQFADDVLQRSAERKANPLPFAMDALGDLFSYVDDKEEGFRRFRRKLEQFFPWADDAIHALERVLADPPDELGDLVRNQAGVRVWVDTPDGPRSGDAAAHEAWMRETVPRMRAMVDAYIAERRSQARTDP
jgi:hypothetical protein